jgi:hypothetical protein
MLAHITRLKFLGQSQAEQDFTCAAHTNGLGPIKNFLIKSVQHMSDEDGIQKVPDYLWVLDEVIEYYADALQGRQCDGFFSLTECNKLIVLYTITKSKNSNAHQSTQMYKSTYHIGCISDKIRFARLGCPLWQSNLLVVGVVGIKQGDCDSTSGVNLVDGDGDYFLLADEHFLLW